MQTRATKKRITRGELVLFILLLTTPLFLGCAIYFGSLGSDLDERSYEELTAQEIGRGEQDWLNNRITVELKDGSALEGIAVDVDTIKVLFASSEGDSICYRSVVNSDIASVKRQKTVHFWRNLGVVLGLVVDVVILVP